MGNIRLQRPFWYWIIGGLLYALFTGLGVMALRGATCGSLTTPNGTTLAQGAVLQVQWVDPTAGYVDDDQGAPSLVTVTGPSGQTVYVGVYQTGPGVAEAQATSPMGFNVAAGFVSASTYAVGAWYWSLAYQNRAASYTCTAGGHGTGGDFTVTSAWAPGYGFIRQQAGTLNLITDGNGKLFTGVGFNMYPNIFNNFTQAALPAQMTATLNTTTGDLAWVSGATFSTASQPSGVYNWAEACSPNSGDGTNNCTIYWNTTVNSTTDETVNLSNKVVIGNGASSGTVTAWAGLEQDHGIGGSNPTTRYAVTLAQAAARMGASGVNLSRSSDNNNGQPALFPVDKSGWLATGYNLYCQVATSVSNCYAGMPTMDLWMQAENASGVHPVLGIFAGNDEPCAYSGCTAAQISNLKYYMFDIIQRYGAYGPMIELNNEVSSEAGMNATWISYLTGVLASGLSGTMCAPSCPGTPPPADPYQNLVSVSDWPPYDDTPFCTTITTCFPNSNTFVEHNHGVGEGATDYQILGDFITSFVTNAHFQSGSLPGFNGEVATTGMGTLPGSQTASAPVWNPNVIRIGWWASGILQIAGNYFDDYSEIVGLNSVTPNFTPYITQVSTDLYRQAAIYQGFMGTDHGLTKITTGLSFACTGGCSGSAALAGLSDTNGNTKVYMTNSANASLISGSTLTVTLPAATSTCQWVNPFTGKITVVSCTPGISNVLTIPDFTVDMAFEGMPSGPSGPTVTLLGTAKLLGTAQIP